MKTWPRLRSSFEKSVDSALSLVGATEALWLTSPPGSQVRRQLSVRQLEAIYEAVFLRIFGYWEVLLQESVIRWMAGYQSLSYTPTPAASEILYGTVSQARTVLFTERGRLRDYLLWHNPSQVTARVSARLVMCPVEFLCSTESTSLEQFAAIRHHIAHGSSDSRTKFMTSAIALTGSDHGGSPGQLLRAPNIADPLNQPKWIRSIVDELVRFSTHVTG